ncbi:MAG TPA: efflux RND transporter periplasmic adaptor subunit [Dongiaceae bacterium]|nr:efflux RND transporter periplasmic adaptor subunit [Dongiaceae bacterium]
MKKSHRMLVCATTLCVLSLAAMAGCGRSDPSRQSSATPAAVAVAQRSSIGNTFAVAGEFVPYQEIEMHAKVSGYVRKIYVDIGDRVKTGQVLAVLEVPELIAQLQGAGAGVRHSQQEVQRMQNEVTRDEAQYAALHANAQRLEEADRTRPGLIAQQELDDAQAKDRAAAAQVESAKSALSAARQQLEMSQASNTQMAAMSDYTRIVAPFDGVVTWRYADTGSLVQAGTSNSNSAPVVKLAQVNVLRLRIPVPESMAATVRVGQTADVAVQATGEHFTGKVTRFTDALDRSTRTMQVEIDVPNESYKLQPGMYANVALQTQSRPDALTIPVQAVQHHDGKAIVLVVDAQNHVQPREIQTGLEDPGRVEVVSGLSEGDRVIVGNFGAFQAGQTVEPKVTKFGSGMKPGGAN